MTAASSNNLREYSVSELAGAVKRVIEDGFGLVRVQGELGRVTRAASGHLYLDLKDQNATISGVIWKGSAQRLRVEPEQGMEVVATGRLTTFPGQSKYQIVIDRGTLRWVMEAAVARSMQQKAALNQGTDKGKKTEKIESPAAIREKKMKRSKGRSAA